MPITNGASEQLILASPRGLLVSLVSRKIAGAAGQSKPTASAEKATNESVNESAEPDAATETMGGDESFDLLGS